MQDVSRHSDDDRIVDDYGREFIARKQHFPASAVGFLIAPVLWFLYFIVIYSLQGVGCAMGLDENSIVGIATLRFMLAIVTLAALVAIAVSGVWSWKSWKNLLHELEEVEHQVHNYSAFLAYGALLHAGLFFVATLWIGIPILLTDACDFLGMSW